MRILAYIGRRLLFVAPQLVGILLVSFLLVKLIPGDPAVLMLGPFATHGRRSPGCAPSSASTARCSSSSCIYLWNVRPGRPRHVLADDAAGHRATSRSAFRRRWNW